MTPAADEYLGPKAARAGVLELHGGGWFLIGPGATAGIRPRAERAASQGYRVLNADYRAGGNSVKDAVAAYDRLKKAVRGGPVCIEGESAGGHLALMVATRRDVACVIAHAAPTDLATLTDSPTIELAKLARRAFGPTSSRMNQYSPLAQAARLNGRILLAAQRGDPVVSDDQAVRLSNRLIELGSPAGLIVMRPGTARYVHGQVDAGQAAQLETYQRALLRSSLRP